MKKTQEILGLPIISISDGIEVGRVKGIIINADKGAIDFVVVESGLQILGARVIQTDNICGIGEYALTIENDGAINDISKIPVAIDLLQKNIQVKGNKVLTRKGRLIGEIGDIYVDEEDVCKITGLEYIADITQQKIRIIPRESVITFGKNLVVVSDDVESKLADTVLQLSSVGSDTEFEKKNSLNTDHNDSELNGYTAEQIDNIISKTDEIIANDGESIFKEIQLPAHVVNEDSNKNSNSDSNEDINQSLHLNTDYTSGNDSIVDASSTVDEIGAEHPEQVEQVYKQEEEQEEVTLEQEAAKEQEPFNGIVFPENDLPDEKPNPQKSEPSKAAGSNAANLFEQRQKQYLKGRRATKTIVSPNGEVIINEGITINDDIIETAKQNGKLIELVMNNKA